MDALNYWSYVTEVWIILGLILIIGDVFLGFNFFVLPIGIAALIMSALVYVDNNEVFGPIVLFSDWKVVIFWFAILSMVSVGLLKYFFQRNQKDEPDVNNY
ncbi:MAG: hypothetical protein HON65_00595 [Rhodospirillales bacterium]|jgi:membrane protein implicated in regulation of membrane protease activity|nr:hypothetical protein [Rhodospirillales bacterium]